MRIEQVGHGAGTRKNRTRPNILRLLVGELEDSGAYEQDEVVLLEAQLDDAPGQTVAYAVECLLEAGALDAYIVPIIMKKGRPGQLLTVIGQPADADRLAAILFRETTTLGLRERRCSRRKLARERVSVETRFGSIRVKLGRANDTVVQAWPEYDDCAAAARQHSVPLRAVQDEALRAWRSDARPPADRVDRQ
jgi:uncharacterized protein (DUF111 family)